MVAIVDYDTGNLRSVCNALLRLGVKYEVTDSIEKIRRSEKVLLPGVGEASSAMQKLRERGLDRLIPSLTQPVLGICIGMQLMCEGSEEGDAHCLSLFAASVKRFASDKSRGVKVPHMGWNRITTLSSPLFKEVPENSFVYFVHSYAAQPCANTIALCENGVPFSAALQRGNFFGVQFHPEKSGATGERILKNFLSL